MIRSAFKKKKTKKCAIKTCRAEFEPKSMSHRICGKEECAIAWGLKEREKRLAKVAKEDRKNASERRQKLKTRSDYIKECQIAFNAYIRARDKAAGYRCISSGEVLDWSGNKVDAGHYRSVGSAPHLRFNPDNCHAQTKKANQYLSGDAVNYRIGLIERIGIERVEALEADNSSPKWSIADIVEMKKQFMRMKKELENEQAPLS